MRWIRMGVAGQDYLVWARERWWGNAWVVLCMREVGNPRSRRRWRYGLHDGCSMSLLFGNLALLGSWVHRQQWLRASWRVIKTSKTSLGVFRCMYMCMVQLYVHIDERDQSVKLVLLVLVSSWSCIVVVVYNSTPPSLTLPLWVPLYLTKVYKNSYTVHA
jgi:hypothetical protein